MVLAKVQGRQDQRDQYRLEHQKKKAYGLLNSLEGIEQCKKRFFDVEPVFGILKRTP